MIFSDVASIFLMPIAPIASHKNIVRKRQLYSRDVILVDSLPSYPFTLQDRWVHHSAHCKVIINVYTHFFTSVQAINTYKKYLS